jgi:branched-chain amino acid aminotransferase
MRDAGAGEALILDAQGRVIEGATSNVFAVRADGVLCTPPESAGILLGITRQVVLDVAAELGFDIELKSLPLAEVKAASELFISSSIREILPVVSVDGVAIGTGKPGPATLRLLERLREVCRSSR